MNDTVSEDVKMDEAGLEAAFKALMEFARTDPDYPHERRPALRVVIRAYLAATKPASPLPGDVTDEDVERAKAAYDPYSAREANRMGLHAALTADRRALASPPMPGRGEGSLAKALNDIGGGHIPGLSDLAIAGDWHEFANRLQAHARAMLAASRPKEDTHAE